LSLSTSQELVEEFRLGIFDQSQLFDFHLVAAVVRRLSWWPISFTGDIDIRVRRMEENDHTRQIGL
jgi:hypothetical protein